MLARTWAALMAATLVAVACGGDETAGTTAGDDVATVATAVAVRIDAGTESTTQPDDGWTTFDDRVEVQVGHGVRTDATGFAQLDWADGSLTRLDAATTVRVTRLADDADRVEVALDLDLGRTWNRVRDLGEDGRFEVATAVATAAVRGTAFVVACLDDGTCTFTVVDGTVEVSSDDDRAVLQAFQRIEVAADGTFGDVVDLVRADLLADPFVADNLARDEDDGFPALDAGDGGDVTAAGTSGEPGPPTSDGVPIPIDAVLAADGAGTSVLLRPDGSTVAVPVGMPEALTMLWLPDGALGIVDGSSVRRVLPDGTDDGVAATASRPIDTFSTNLRGELLLSLRTDDGGGLMQLLDATGTETFALASPAGARLDFPAISPDGATIAAVDFENGQLVLIDVGDGSRTEVPAEAADGWVRWSPDGSQVLFTSDRSGVRFAGDEWQPRVTVHDIASGSSRVFDGLLEADFTSSGAAIVAIRGPGQVQAGPLVRIDLATGQESIVQDGQFGSILVFHGAA